MVFEADSDSVLTKGLAALLVQGLSGRSVEEIVRVSPDFVVLLGLQQSLTPSRNNGFLNMLKLMQKKALELYIEAKRSSELTDVKDSEMAVAGISESGLNSTSEKPVGSSNLSSKIGAGTEDSSVRLSSDVGGRDSSLGEGATSETALGSRGERIKEILQRALSPTELLVEDVSYQHAGHAGVRGSDGETHFNLKVVSEEFEGKSLVKRHRVIYDLLQEELQSGLHALSIVAKTPSDVSGR